MSGTYCRAETAAEGLQVFGGYDEIKSTRFCGCFFVAYKHISRHIMAGDSDCAGATK